MAKPKREDIKKEIEEQKEEVYGESSLAGGSAPVQDNTQEDPSDVDEMIKDTMGEDAEEDVEKGKDAFTLAEEVEDDEFERRGLVDEEEQE